MTNNNDNSTEEAIREAISDSVKSSQGVQHSPMPSPERTGIKRPKSASEIIRCASDDVFSLQTKVGGTHGNADSIGTEGNVPVQQQQQQHTVAAPSPAGDSTSSNGDVGSHPPAATEFSGATDGGNNSVVLNQKYRTFEKCNGSIGYYGCNSYWQPANPTSI